MSLPDLTHLARPGAVIALRATPKASRNRIDAEATPLRVYVTAPPDKGKANEAIRKLLAKAMGLPKTRLTLLRGETAREKQFRVE